jgi:dolichyl-phosphate-mannose--protein O-mannosyl transferase
MSWPAPGWRRDLLLALLLAVLAAAVRLPRLGFPPEEIFDEVYHAKTARQYLNGEAPTEWVHPPTAKLLIAVGVHEFGYKAWAWRLLPVLAGIALAPVFFLLARRVLPTERAALFASFLLLCDGVYLVQSRVAMTNIFAVLFQVASALFIVRAARRKELAVWDMMAAGVCLGLALSTRWTSLWAAAFLGLTLVALRGWRILRWQELVLVALAFAIIPAQIYVLSYVPWMRQGHSLGDMVRMQGSMWHYHATLNATHPYFSKWYTWPWLVRPTWYYFNSDAGWTRGMVAIGNPALWWVSVPVSVWAIVSALRAKPRDAVLLFSGLGFFALYLPWGISPRTLNYSHYLFEAIPYACLSLGVLLDRLWGRRDGSARNIFGEAGVIAYLALVLALFVLFFPFLTAFPVPDNWFNQPFLFGVRPWTWFPSWI